MHITLRVITPRKLAPRQRIVSTVKTFDEVLGTRDAINTAFARDVGVFNQDDISHNEGKDNLILFRIYSLKAEKGVQS